MVVLVVVLVVCVGGVGQSKTGACEREGAKARVTRRRQRNEAPLTLSAPKPPLARRCTQIGAGRYGDGGWWGWGTDRGWDGLS